ncbi:MAG: bifunctional nicotinamide-nucleotide adenylyltransferase/Nudix hydroxylase [Methylobacteriaceae bacterium]|nr:bifunctional nicotinamide-nucleotide adenylyltransferase/Nudix hydroxylase [Methylobacteriaceae bacterium]
MRDQRAPFDALVFIGRFQPLHNGHVAVMREALAAAPRLVVLVGSANVARSPRNPFTYDERKAMIEACAADGLSGDAAGRLIVRPLADVAYNDQAWLAEAQRQVTRALREAGVEAPRIGLIGHAKDGTGYYLKLFPEWGSLDVVSRPMLNATDLRLDYLRPAARMPSEHLCPPATIDFLARFMQGEAFRWLVEEAQFYADYKARWGATPYPVFINCVDAVVVQSGHILLVERAHRPGKGLLALPGGHVDPGERFRDAAIRELKEETRISDGRGEIPPGMLGSFVVDDKTRLFDDPHRSERGRVVTQAFLFELPARKQLFTVRGDDDASSARWHELGSLRADAFFEDHAAIIREMTGATLE